MIFALQILLFLTFVILPCGQVLGPGVIPGSSFLTHIDAPPNGQSAELHIIAKAQNCLVQDWHVPVFKGVLLTSSSTCFQKIHIECLRCARP